MKRINVKHNYILPQFNQFSKQMLIFIAFGGDIQKQLGVDVLQSKCS